MRFGDSMIGDMIMSFFNGIPWCFFPDIGTLGLIATGAWLCFAATLRGYQEALAVGESSRSRRSSPEKPRSHGKRVGLLEFLTVVLMLHLLNLMDLMHLLHLRDRSVFPNGLGCFCHLRFQICDVHTSTCTKAPSWSMNLSGCFGSWIILDLLRFWAFFSLQDYIWDCSKGDDPGQKLNSQRCLEFRAAAVARTAAAQVDVCTKVVL